MNNGIADMNKVELIGTINNMFGTNTTPKGTKYTNFIVKTEEKNSKGYEQNATVMCCRFGEFSFSVGDRVHIEGRLSTKKNDDGKYHLSVIANTMINLVPKKEKELIPSSDEYFINSNPPLPDAPF